MEPGGLDAVVVDLVRQQGAVDERQVDEFPGMAVDTVLVADVRKEAPRLQREAARQRELLDQVLLRCDARTAELHRWRFVKSGEIRPAFALFAW